MLEAASSEHARVVLRARVRTIGESGGKVPLESPRIAISVTGSLVHGFVFEIPANKP